MENKVREIQKYLHERGIEEPETSIVNAAIDISRRLGPGDYTFFCEFENVKENRIEIETNVVYEDIPEHIRSRIFQDLGLASICWDNIGHAGTLKTEELAQIGLSLCEFIMRQIND